MQMAAQLPDNYIAQKHQDLQEMSEAFLGSIKDTGTMSASLPAGTVDNHSHRLACGDKHR